MEKHSQPKATTFDNIVIAILLLGSLVAFLFDSFSGLKL